MHGRYRMGHRALVRGVRPTAEQHEAYCPCTKALPTGRIFPDSGRSSTTIASPFSTPRPPHSGLPSSGATNTLQKHKLDSLRLLGTVGEPINPEAWMWYREKIRAQPLPDRIDTWWQTETGSIMIAPISGAAPRVRRRRRSSASSLRWSRAKACKCLRAAAACSWSGGRGPRWRARSMAIRNATRRRIGATCRAATSPATAHAVDADGSFWLMGRVDDVINVSGHGPEDMEVEWALVAHPKVAEAAVVA